jgi:tRNA nucleotidyltransferase (CCA-adding enzyme)
VSHPVHNAEQVLARLTGLPGGPELLAQARRREDVALVGGAIRDVLLGHWPRELDVTVAADAAGLATALAAAISPGERAYGRAVEPVLHERFGTASVAWQYGRIDVAERRAESYPAPGALPEVRPGSFEEDLRRRDFTVNAIALPLHGAENEGLVSVEGALDDLRAGLLRVLHDRSFLDDPTRILRLARYAARLGFEIAPHTRELAEQAVAQDALGTVSGGRLSSELWLAAGEETGRGAFAVLGRLGVLAALGMPTPFDEKLAEDAGALLPADGSQAALLIGVALHPTEDDGGNTAAASIASMHRLEFTSEQFNGAFRAANGVAGLAEALVSAADRGAPMLHDSTPEGMAVGGALAGRRSARAVDVARDWFAVQRHIALEIDGNDLLAAGLAEGPEIGRRLRATLWRKREGLVSGREEELRAALEWKSESLGRVVET